MVFILSVQQLTWLHLIPGDFDHAPSGVGFFVLVDNKCSVCDPQPTFGYIEREDLEKFTFSFDAFFGNPKAMTPGVRVHFTACKEKV